MRWTRRARGKKLAGGVPAPAKRRFAALCGRDAPSRDRGARSGGAAHWRRLEVVRRNNSSRRAECRRDPAD
jgi:hypothetical protein